MWLDEILMWVQLLAGPRAPESSAKVSSKSVASTLGGVQWAHWASGCFFPFALIVKYLVWALSINATDTHTRWTQTVELSCKSVTIFTLQLYIGWYFVPTRSHECLSEVTEFHNVVLKVIGCERQCATEHHHTKPQRIKPEHIITRQASAQPTASSKATAKTHDALSNQERLISLQEITHLSSTLTQIGKKDKSFLLYIIVKQLLKDFTSENKE